MKLFLKCNHTVLFFVLFCFVLHIEMTCLFVEDPDEIVFKM